MATLTDRQARILKSIIEEYIDTAVPVGSEKIEKKYSVGVSPATIRNEMVKLTEQGFLKKAHSSSGRIPTSTGLKYYVANLMKEQQMPLADEVAVKEKVWDYRHEPGKLLREMTRELAQRTKELAVATTDEGDIYTSGMAHILDAPEFFDIDLTKALLSCLDEAGFWRELLERSGEEGPIGILLGSDLREQLFEPCGFVYHRFEAGPRKGVIGVVGPARLEFDRLFPTIKYFGQLIDEIFRGW